MPKVSKSALSDLQTAALRKKAYNAFNNAKQRCENPKNPSYHSYGKLGVKVIFGSFDEFLDHIGLPPNEKASLDRINADGNYEVGNVRWASASIQAINKKGNPLSSTLSVSFQKAALLDKQKARAKREATTKAFNIVIKAISEGGFSTASVQFLAENYFSPSFFEAGWEPGQERICDGLVSFFYMPSLTHLGERIRMIGGPLETFENDNGVLRKLEVVNNAAFHALKKPFVGNEKGSIMLGGKAAAWRDVGGVEGIFMLAASRMQRANRKVAFVPLMTLLDRLRDIGPKNAWDTTPSRVLDTHWVFVPDFQIEYGDAVQPNGPEWSLLAQWIDYRLDYGKPIFLGIQNFNGVPWFIREKLLLNCFFRELPEEPEPSQIENHVFVGDTVNDRGFTAVRAALMPKFVKCPSS